MLFQINVVHLRHRQIGPWGPWGEFVGLAQCL